MAAPAVATPFTWTFQTAGGAIVGTARAQPAESPAEAEVAVEQPDDLVERVEQEHAISDAVWLLLSLVLVVVIAWRPAKRALLGSLDERAARIRRELEEARRLREEAQAALADFQRKHRDAMAEAEAIIEHARTEAERMRSQAAAELEQTLARREAQALDRIAQAEAAAAREVRDLAVDAAVAAARQMLAERLPAERARALIDEAIEQLPRHLH